LSLLFAESMIQFVDYIWYMVSTLNEDICSQMFFPLKKKERGGKNSPAFCIRERYTMDQLKSLEL